MSRLWWMGLGLGLAVAAGPRAPTVRTPFPFDHGHHARTFDQVDLGCVDCHPVGLAVGTVPETGPPSPERGPSLASCHGCHLGTWPGAARRAPDGCETCHSVRAELLPTSHGVDWGVAHGEAARVRDPGCAQCHDRTSCVDCHERRGPGTRNPHPPGFGRTHGVEARLDPVSCSSCHPAQVCADCHVGGVRPW